MSQGIFSWENYGDGVLLSCGLLLPPDQSQTLTELNNEVSQKDRVLYSFSQTPPYLRLYQLVMPRKNQKEAADRIAKVATQNPEIKLKWGEIETSKTQVILWAELTVNIGELQKELVTKLNPLREGYCRHKDVENNVSLTQSQKQSVLKWGWPWVADYKPYIVIAKADKTFNLSDFEITWNYTQATLSQIIVGEKVAPGTLKDQQRFTLQPA